MSDVGKELYGLERKLLGKVEHIDPKGLTGFRAYLNKSNTSLLINWDATGSIWEKLTGEIEATAPGARGPAQLKKKKPYHIEISVFFIDGAVEPPTWEVTGQSWDEQKPSSFVAFGRIGDGKAWLSGWVPLEESPFLSATDAEDEIAKYVKRAKRARRSSFGLGLFVGAILFSMVLYGGFEFLRSNPERFQDAFDWVDSKVELPDISKIPNKMPGKTGESEPSQESAESETPSPTPSPPASTTNDAEKRSGSKQDKGRVDTGSDDEKVKDLERALADARDRNQELDGEVARKEQELAARRKDLAAVRKGAGLSLPPCWPDASGTYTEFIFDVHVSDAGIMVSKVYPEHRAVDYRELPVRDTSLGVYHDRDSFIAAFGPLYELSRTQDCRHYVHLLEGTHADLNTYKIQRDTVEGLFYIHRPIWNK